MTRQEHDGQHPASPRWQYAVVWRYGPLGLVLLGLAMIAYAMAAERSDAATVSLLTLGLVSVVAGVVLPRIEGEVSAGGQGVAGKLLSVTPLFSVLRTGGSSERTKRGLLTTADSDADDAARGRRLRWWARE